MFGSILFCASVVFLGLFYGLQVRADKRVFEQAREEPAPEPDEFEKHLSRMRQR